MAERLVSWTAGLGVRLHLHFPYFPLNRHTPPEPILRSVRRLCATLAVLAFAVPAAALAGVRGPGDGTLSVRDGHGTFSVSARGGVIGSFARGRVVITDPDPNDGTGPIVTGDDWHKERTDTTTVYGGTKVRFRLIGGSFRIRVVAAGVNLSVVGKGTAGLNGEGTADDGTYSVDGGDYVPVPDIATTLSLP
jgi:hypothetical protein